jgi:hypothetical protein
MPLLTELWICLVLFYKYSSPTGLKYCNKSAVRKRRRRGIFVEKDKKDFQAPSGAASSVGTFNGARFYKYSSPTGLKHCN